MRAGRSPGGSRQHEIWKASQRANREPGVVGAPSEPVRQIDGLLGEGLLGDGAVVLLTVHRQNCVKTSARA